MRARRRPFGTLNTLLYTPTTTNNNQQQTTNTNIDSTNDKPVCLALVKFIAHLVNQGVAHELLALELLVLLLGANGDGGIEGTRRIVHGPRDGDAAARIQDERVGVVVAVGHTL